MQNPEAVRVPAEPSGTGAGGSVLMRCATRPSLRVFTGPRTGTDCVNPCYPVTSLCFVSEPPCGSEPRSTNRTSSSILLLIHFSVGSDSRVWENPEEVPDPPGSCRPTGLPSPTPRTSPNMWRCPLVMGLKLPQDRRITCVLLLSVMVARSASARFCRSRSSGRRCCGD